MFLGIRTNSVLVNNFFENLKKKKNLSGSTFLASNYNATLLADPCRNRRCSGRQRKKERKLKKKKKDRLLGADTLAPGVSFNFGCEGVDVLRGQKGRDSAVCVQRMRIMDVKAHQIRCLKMHERTFPPRTSTTTTTTATTTKKKNSLPPQNRAITGACYLPEPPGRKW